MQKKTFNKLVRDKIPEIIEKNGEIPEIEILNNVKYRNLLNEKLLEECNELLGASDNQSKAEEMADIFEVLYAIMDELGIAKEELEKIREEKKEKRGAFKNKILLKSTIRNLKQVSK